MPALNAYFVSSLELVGGILLLLGLMSRLISIPLMGTMVVAIITAKWEDVSSISDLVGLNEFAYLVLLCWIAIAGPGWASVDHVLSKRFLVQIPRTAKPAA